MFSYDPSSLNYSLVQAVEQDWTTLNSWNIILWSLFLRLFVSLSSLAGFSQPEHIRNYPSSHNYWAVWAGLSVALPRTNRRVFYNPVPWITRYFKQFNRVELHRIHEIFFYDPCFLHYMVVQSVRLQQPETHEHFVRPRNLPEIFHAFATPSFNFRQLSVHPRNLLSTFHASKLPSHSVNFLCVHGTFKIFRTAVGFSVTFSQLSVRSKDFLPTFRASRGLSINFPGICGTFRQLSVLQRDLPTTSGNFPWDIPKNCFNFSCGRATFHNFPCGQGIFCHVSEGPRLFS